LLPAEEEWEICGNGAAAEIGWSETGRRSVLFVVAAAGADAQEAAGEGIQGPIRRVGQLPGTITFTDADDEQDEHDGYNDRQGSGYCDNTRAEAHQITPFPYSGTS
jgi:hypothetical protein